MLVTPPTYVKKDGVQYRVDGVSKNFVFIWSQHNKGFVFDVSTGSLIANDYHPVTLASRTYRSKDVLEGILGQGSTLHPHEFSDAGQMSTDTLRKLRGFSMRLSKLTNLDVPCSVLKLHLLPVVEALLNGVPAKELNQGIKSLYDFDVPKIVVNYLNGGYQMPFTLERLLRMIGGEAMIRPGIDEPLSEVM